jgi:hypothetical protein
MSSPQEAHFLLNEVLVCENAFADANFIQTRFELRDVGFED